MSAKKPETTTITAEEAEKAFRGTWHPVAIRLCFFCDSRGCAECGGRGMRIKDLEPVTAETRKRVLEDAAQLIEALDPNAEA